MKGDFEFASEPEAQQQAMASELQLAIRFTLGAKLERLQQAWSRVTVII
jgi:hypothetical protein